METGRPGVQVRCDGGREEGDKQKGRRNRRIRGDGSWMRETMRRKPSGMTHKFLAASVSL